jgi:hypothetical protein
VEHTRKNTDFPRQSSATLVVIPSHLIGQWKSEIDKFSSGLNVLTISDLGCLKKLKVKDIVNADCVICPFDILQADGYLVNLLKKSGSDVQDCPPMPSLAGQKELSSRWKQPSRKSQILDKI